MRLLNRDSDGQLRLAEFNPDNIPRYAILSHTWGSDEVLFRDIHRKRYHNKAGYEKIKFCLQQAKADDLQYCWVDTCCIDKQSLIELTEAVNSMFRWYANAEICYVYLSDVSLPHVSISSTSTHHIIGEAFRSSRWFTRGWTLQELLAPGIVKFFSSDGQFIGDKGSLIQEIHERTQIPITALQGDTLVRFSVKERMSWISNRNTTMEEDMAYSVVGLFGVYLPLAYGEGRQRAETRLVRKIEESRQLSKPVNSHDFTLPFWLPVKLEPHHWTDRDNELSQMREALPSNGRHGIVVLHGSPGVGKTQLAIKYVLETLGDYTAVLWLNFMTEESLQQSFTSVANRIGRTRASLLALKPAAESSDASKSVDTVLHWLDRPGNERWLLIINDADAPHITGVVDGPHCLQQYLPSAPHGHVVITTRSSQLDMGKQIEVRTGYDINKCLTILEAVTQRPNIKHDIKAIELIEKLCGIKLAVSAAGHYMHQVAISPAEYLKQYERTWLRLQQSQNGLSKYYEETIGRTTLEMLQRQIAAKNPGTYRLLRLWGSFARKDIWYELLATGKYDAPEWFTVVMENKITFNEHMQVLCDIGFAETQREYASFTMPTYIHDWVRESSDSDNRGTGYKGDGNIHEDLGDEEAHLALRCISLAVSYINNAESPAVKRRLLNHADSWLERYRARELDSKQHKYLQRLAILYEDQGRLSEANTIWEQIIGGKEKATDHEHISALSTIYNSDTVYGSRGRPEETENSGTLVDHGQFYQSQTVNADSVAFPALLSAPGLCEDSLVQTLMEADATDIESQASFQQSSQSEIEDSLFCDLLCGQQVLIFLCNKVVSNGLQARKLFEESMIRALKKLYLRSRESSTTTEGNTDLPFLRNRLRRRKIAMRMIDRVACSKLQTIEEESEYLDKVEVLHSASSDSSEEDSLDEQSSQKELPVEHPRAPSLLANALSTANMNKALTKHGMLDQFLADLCINFLPPHLRFIIENAPAANLKVVHRERWSLINLIKLRVNGAVNSEWTWKPWTTGSQPIKSDHRRLILHCCCGQKLTRDVPFATAEILQMIIRIRQISEPATENWLGELSKRFTEAVSPSGGQTSDNTQRAVANSATSSRYIPAAIRSQRPPAFTNSHLNTGQASATSTDQAQVYSANNLWLVLGYHQGSRPTVEIEHIPISDQKGDLDCCSELKQQYHRHRGFWRHWFSIWHLDSCQFVKFDKLCHNAVTYHPDEWPQSHPDYEIESVYPSNGPPPISESHFRMYLDLCETARCCSWRIFHECMAGTFRNSRWLIERVPKKRSRFDYQRDNSGALAWGLRPVLRLSLPRVIYWHVAIIAGPFAFWWIWLAGHPSDLQTAAVPLALVTGSVSMFWAAKEALHK